VIQLVVMDVWGSNVLLKVCDGDVHATSPLKRDGLATVTPPWPPPQHRRRRGAAAVPPSQRRRHVCSAAIACSAIAAQKSKKPGETGRPIRAFC